MNALMRGLIDTAELCSTLHITPVTAARWRREADGLPYLKIGKRVYYREDAVREWITSREVKPNPRRRRAG
jgi:hypothetical protein